MTILQYYTGGVGGGKEFAFNLHIMRLVRHGHLAGSIIVIIIIITTTECGYIKIHPHQDTTPPTHICLSI